MIHVISGLWRHLEDEEVFCDFCHVEKRVWCENDHIETKNIVRTLMVIGDDEANSCKCFRVMGNTRSQLQHGTSCSWTANNVITPRIEPISHYYFTAVSFCIWNYLQMWFLLPVDATDLINIHQRLCSESIRFQATEYFRITMTVISFWMYKYIYISCVYVLRLIDNSCCIRDSNWTFCVFVFW
jgi:hypothetical protein